MRLGPTRSDWLLVLISAVFAAGGLALAVGEGEKAGIAVAAFFGGCFAVGIWMLLRKFRTVRHSQAIRVDVPEGVPITAPTTPFLALAAGLAVVGFVCGWTSAAIGPVFVVISYGIGALGAALLVLIPTGVIPRPFMQFEPTGLRFGQRGFSYVLLWDNVAQVALGDIGGHDTLLVMVGDVQRLLATVDARGPRDTAVRRLARQLQWNRSLLRCDLAITPLQFGADMALLLGAIKRYVADLDERQIRRASALPEG